MIFWHTNLGITHSVPIGLLLLARQIGVFFYNNIIIFIFYFLYVIFFLWSLVSHAHYSFPRTVTVAGRWILYIPLAFSPNRHFTPPLNHTTTDRDLDTMCDLCFPLFTGARSYHPPLTQNIKRNIRHTIMIYNRSFCIIIHLESCVCVYVYYMRCTRDL